MQLFCRKSLSQTHLLQRGARTCAGMRRRFPGHKSYGLGKLCEIYGIDLDNHHRALCDARASAHLLNQINRKRDEEVAPKAEAA